MAVKGFTFFRQVNIGSLLGTGLDKLVFHICRKNCIPKLYIFHPLIESKLLHLTTDLHCHVIETTMSSKTMQFFYNS